MSEQLNEALRTIVEYVQPGIYEEISEEEALKIALAYAKGYSEGVKSINEPVLTKQGYTERKGA